MKILDVAVVLVLDVAVHVADFVADDVVML
jgi:hypothetical protein